MDHSLLETLLWCLVGLVGAFVSGFLFYGWFRGLNWEKEQRLRKRHRYRYD